MVAGGVGQAILGELSNMGSATPTLVLGIPDEFVEQGKCDAVLSRMGLDAAGIASAIRAKLS